MQDKATNNTQGLLSGLTKFMTWVVAEFFSISTALALIHYLKSIKTRNFYEDIYCSASNNNLKYWKIMMVWTSYKDETLSTTEK